MAASLDTPKIFISYSWHPIVNKQKTLELAKRLISNGVNVIIDEWNLAEGHDKFHFMEQMVNDNEIKRVLIICNKDYTDKANQKQGGVGIESLIVSSEIYNQVDQKKFIPVIFEKDENNKAYVPTFINSRIYIDLSSEEVFEDNYEKLLRNIFERPASKQPPIGNPPLYLIQEEPVYLRTAHKVSSIRKALVEEKQISKILIKEYYSTFLESLKDFEVKDEEISVLNHIDETIIAKIDAIKPLRDDYISFLETVLTYSISFDFDGFITFFENIITFFKNQKLLTGSPYSNGAVKADQFKFFFYEIALYSCLIMIEMEEFVLLSKIIHHSYLIFAENYSEPVVDTFSAFNKRPESLDKIRNERLDLRRVSVSADLIRQRADNPKYTFQKIIECDVLLYYITTLQTKGNHSIRTVQWFPHTSSHEIYSLPIIQKLISDRHFQKVKVLFDVQTVEELKSKVWDAINKGLDNFQRFYYEFPYMNNVFEFDKMGQIK